MSDISFVYVSGTLDRAMGQTKKKVVARRHLVCGNCASWVHLETSGCEKKWANTRAEGFVFTCKGCTEVAVLVKEVSGLKQMMEDMKETVAGLHLEDKGAETGSTSGCEKKWANTRAEGFVFTCKGCTEVAVLIKEVSGLKQMMEDMKETVAGLHLEDKGAETGSRVMMPG